MEPSNPKTTFVWNPILRQYILNAPHQIVPQKEVNACPFCLDIFEGKVSPEKQVWLRRQDIARIHPPTGEAYDIIYSHDHHRTFSQLTIDEMYAVTLLWRDLYCDLASRYPAVIISEKEEFIGQAKYHPHGQAFGISIIPSILEQELETVIQDDLDGHGCPFCRISAELRESIYLVASNPTWQTFLPPYVRYPYEVHLYPRRHVANLDGMYNNELHDLAALILQVMQGYNALLDGAMSPMPYLLGLHQLANGNFHFHVEILALARAPGKLKLTGSSESIWDFWVNDSSPAQNARELREAITKVKY